MFLWRRGGKWSDDHCSAYHHHLLAELHHYWGSIQTRKCPTPQSEAIPRIGHAGMSDTLSNVTLEEGRSAVVLCRQDNCRPSFLLTVAGWNVMRLWRCFLFARVVMHPPTHQNERQCPVREHSVKGYLHSHLRRTGNLLDQLKCRIYLE